MMRRCLILILGLSWLLLPGGTAGAARIVAVGDIHGEIDGFDAVLQATRLTDANGRWVGGDAILVQTGDVTDRGPRVRAVMDRLRALEQQAPAAGGRVVALLGNHEISNLAHLFDETSTPPEVYRQTWASFAGKRAARRQKAAYRQWYRWYERYPGCVKEGNRAWIDSREAWLEDHPAGFVEYIEAISPEGEYGRWLRSLDVAAEIDGTIFVHGGISPTLVERGYRSVAAINQAVAAALEQLDRDRRRLIDEQVIVPFSSMWETLCGVFVEMARLEQDASPPALARRAELEEINTRLPGMPGWFPTEVDGPLWYRGLANADEAEFAPSLDAILAAYSAERIAVGHTPQPGKIVPRFNGRVYLLDTAMAYAELGGRAAALEIDGDRVTAIYPDQRVLLATGEAATETPPPGPIEGTNGDTHPPVEGTNGQADRPVEGTNGNQAAATEAATAAGDTADSAEPVWIGPDGEPLPFADVDEVLDFLAKAEVVDSSAIGTGVTEPRKLVLELDGVRAHGIFHDVEIVRRRERLRGGKVVNFFRDHYANNVAAFELSRMLGMTNVPPAVVRKVGRQEGSVQLWIEGSSTEADRRRLGIEPPSNWRLMSKDMLVFDNLTNNIDRNQGNILYDANWKLWFIDHTRAFGRIKQLPSAARVRRCSRALYQALRELDEEEARRRLRPYIGIYEIKGMMARRDLLLALIEERIAATSELAVLFDYHEAVPTDGEDPDVPDIPEAPPPEP
jgi:hypothetical protein